MTTILQISDTHIVPDGNLVSSRLDTGGTLTRLIARIGEVRAQIGPVDAVLISGDLVDDGSAESYARLKQLLGPLDLPLFVVPGNHDAREPMRAAFADRLPASGRLHWVRQVGDICLIGLDTLVEGRGHGTLGPDSLAFLSSALETAAGAPVMLALHHPPFSTGITFLERISLTDSQAFCDIVGGYQGPLRIVCGHIHTLIFSDVAGHVAVSAPSPSSTFAYDIRPDAMVGYMAQEDGCLLHRWKDGFQTMRLAPDAGAGPYPF